MIGAHSSAMIGAGPAMAILVTVLSAGSAQAEVAKTTFETRARAEALATITVTCDTCAWDVAGREAVVLSIALDGRYLQHLPIVRTGQAEYRVMLGRVEPGLHTVVIDQDAELTAPALRGGAHIVVNTIVVDQIDAGARAYTAISLAPIVYARPDTVGTYTDVPVFMWYEIEPTARGTRYRYSVIFTNEDGGTPADRLMVTWGRTTDIGYLYSVEIDRTGAILDDDIQGPEHEVLPFKGRREGAHPLLWVSTDNNMVLPEGTTRVRYAPAPMSFALRDVSREAVMDAHPWLYAVMANELIREAKIVAGAPAGQGTIPDPRCFVFIEGCGELADKALTFAVRVGAQWISSDRGVSDYRIVRDGCFRAAIPLSATANLKDVRAIRAQVFAREGQTNTAPARLTRINTVFALDERFVPGTTVLHWTGAAQLRPGGPAFELAVR
ncbi:MAG: hypothetical protein H0W08_09725 [Acidobacteria bacterium]|nr:hypothetical protein [Acidobacteriota bacterium]